MTQEIKTTLPTAQNNNPPRDYINTDILTLGMWAQHDKDPKACCRIAQLHLFGHKEAQKRPDLAVEWYATAIRNGSIEALAGLAACYEKGWGVPQNSDNALFFYLLAITYGDQSAQNRMLRFSKALSEKGDANGQYYLGRCYEEGWGENVNQSEATHCFRLSANQQFKKAQVHLGLYYENKSADEKKILEAQADQLKQLETQKGAALLIQILKDVNCSNEIISEMFATMKTVEKSKVEPELPKTQQESNPPTSTEQKKTPNKKRKHKKKPKATSEDDDDKAKTNKDSEDNQSGVNPLSVPENEEAPIDSEAVTQEESSPQIEERDIKKDPEKTNPSSATENSPQPAEGTTSLVEPGEPLQTQGENVDAYAPDSPKVNNKPEAPLNKEDLESDSISTDLKIPADSKPEEKEYDAERDIDNAARFYQPAIQKELAADQFISGLQHENGDGVPQDKETAIRFYQSAARQGNTLAQCKLALLYETGDGVPQDEAIAIGLYKIAAVRGNTTAQCALAIRYEHGWGVQKNISQALHYYHLAANAGNASAQCTLGRRSQYITKDPKEAVRWYRLAALQGLPEAQFNLGLCFEYGTGITKNETLAVRWYRLAAEQGHPVAQCRLGLCCEKGIGTGQNAQEAVHWYRLAAAQGDAQAQFNLGLCHQLGKGTEKDEQEAAHCYQAAAQQGFADAQYNLGVCYEQGMGVPKDLLTAATWYERAAAQDDTDAQAALNRPGWRPQPQPIHMSAESKPFAPSRYSGSFYPPVSSSQSIPPTHAQHTNQKKFPSGFEPPPSFEKS